MELDTSPQLEPLVTREAVESFTRRLVDCFAPEKVILFGSMARGEHNTDSDADLLVVMPYDGRAFEKVLEIRRTCRPAFPLDLLLWRPEEVESRYGWGDPFIREAIDHGVVLYG